MLDIGQSAWTHEVRFPGRKPGEESLNIVLETPYESLRHREVLVCKECGAVVLDDTTNEHSDWHDRQAAADTVAAFPTRYSIRLDADGDPMLVCNDCSDNAAISELGYLRFIEPGENFGYAVDRILHHERGVHA